MSETADGAPESGADSLARELGALRQSGGVHGPVEPAENHDHSADHLALVYESRDEQFAAVVPFVRQGLERGERCLYVTDENSRTEILEALRDGGVDVDAAIESGALEILTVHETYLEDGSFDVEESLALLEDAMTEAVADHEGFRVTVEETWLLDEVSATEGFMELEARVNELFRDRECMALCQYNRERFPSAIIREVIRRHPLLVYDNTLNDNVYYRPPEEVLTADDPAREVDRRLEALREQSETRRAHQRVIDALEAAREGISLLDENGEFIYVNDAYADTFGYDPGEMIGEHCDELGIEDDPEYVYDEILPAIDREGQWTGTTTCVRRDGGTFLAQHSLTQTEDDELICVVRDVTERSERERQLEESRRRYQTLVENFPNGAVTLVDDDLTYRTVGGTPVDEETETADDLEGAHVREAISTELADVLEPRYRAALDGERSEFEVEHGGNHSRIHVYPVRDDDGEVFAAMGMSQDITQRTERKRTLRRLYEITADPEKAFEEKLDDLFELGCEHFGLDYGGIARIDPERDRLEVRAISGDHERLEPGRRVPLSETHCRLVTDHTETVSVADTAAAGLEDTISHTEFGVEAYLGTRIQLDGERDATFFFFSSEPRDRQFSEASRTLFRLMGQWVKYELERRQRVRELRERTERLSAIIETSPDCIKTVSPDGTLLQMNSAGLEMGEADSESDVVGESVYDLVAPEHRERYREFNERVCRGEPGTLEFDIIGLEGTRRHMESHAAPLERPDGSTVQVAVTRDVTEQVEREEDLERALDLLERTERIAAVGGWEIDVDTREVFWTDHVFELLEMDAEEEPPLEEALDMYHEDDRPVVANAVEDALEAGDPFDVEARIRTEGDELRWLRLQGIPETEGAEVVTLRGAAQDVTERKRREQRLEDVIDELETSNDRLKQFAYAASHDLQEPLRMVSSYMQLLENEYGEQLDDEAREYIEFAVDGADRMRAMVDDLLAYSRVERSDGQFETVQSDAILDRVTDDLRVRIEETDAEIAVEPLPAITADSEQVEQLFQNLLANAIKYSGDDPPRIEVCAERRADMWEFSVADEGIGIDPEKTDRIFEVFKRLHHDDEYSGTGIGLSLCQEIVENHGGEIWVESEPGEGSTFSFTLPAADGDASR